MKLLLFDVDQTLVNTGGAGLRALDRACYKVLSIQSAMEGIDPSGKTDPAIVREILSRRGDGASRDLHVQPILDAYLFYLREEVHLSERYQILPGIVDLLDQLSTRSDVMLGLATGNIESGAQVKLGRGNLNQYFGFGGFGSDSEHRPTLVRMAAELAARKYGSPIGSDDTFVIGDTPLDVEAGRAAGYKTVGVATGRYSTSQLSKAGATFVISDFLEGRSQFLASTALT